jgi:hypothetical protein
MATNSTKSTVYADAFIDRLKSLKLGKIQLNTIRKYIDAEIIKLISDKTKVGTKKVPSRSDVIRMQLHDEICKNWALVYLTNNAVVKIRGIKETQLVISFDNNNLVSMNANITNGDVSITGKSTIHKLEHLDKILVDGKFVDIYKLAIGGL